MRNAVTGFLVGMWMGAAGCRHASPLPPGPVASTTPSASASTAVAPRSLQTGLVAELRTLRSVVPRVQELRVSVTLRNGGAGPLRVRTRYLGSPISFEVRDAGGKPVPSGPPPTPVVDDGVAGWRVLGPGDGLTLEGDPGIQIDVAPGRYEVRFRGVPGDPANAEVKSPWVPFDVSSAAAAAPCGACLGSRVEWTTGGGLAPGEVHTLTPCNTYSSRTFNTPQPDTCTGTVSCDPAREGSTVAIARVLADPDVKAALARPSTRYGWRSPAFEGGDFLLSVDGASISVASDCAGHKPCIDVPRGLRRAVEYLERHPAEDDIAELTCR